MSMFKVTGGKMFILPPVAKPVKQGMFFLPKKKNACGCPICEFEKDQRAMSKPALTPLVLPSVVADKGLDHLNKKGCCKYWPDLTNEALTRQGNECFYCTARPETGLGIWHFDYDTRTVVLKEIVVVCKWCYRAVNIAESEESDYFQEVLRHIATVRGMKKQKVGELIRAAYDNWETVTQSQWKLSYGEFVCFIHEPGKLPDVSVFEKLPKLKDHERKPSQTNHVKFLLVKRDPNKTLGKGPFPIFILSGSMQAVDQIWACAANMTKNGHLAAEAFASTMRESEIKPILSSTGFVGVVLDETDSKDAIEKTLKVLFGHVAKSIQFTRGGMT